MIYLFLLLSAFSLQECDCQKIELQNLSKTIKYRVWVSEGNDVIFNGTIYPSKTIWIPITEGKVYGINATRLNFTGESAPAVKSIHDPAKIVTKGDTDYYRAKPCTNLIYFLYPNDTP